MVGCDAFNFECPQRKDYQAALAALHSSSSADPPCYMDAAFADIIASPYWRELTVLDLQARGASSVAELQARYLSHVRLPTVSERVRIFAATLIARYRERGALAALAQRLHPPLRSAVPTHFTIPLRLVVVTHEEAGWPHTHGRTVVLTPTAINLPLADLAGIVLHERLHVWQRANRAQVQRAYRSSGLRVCARAATERGNPDTAGEPTWAWRGSRLGRQLHADARSLAATVPEARGAALIAGWHSTDHPHEQLGALLERGVSAQPSPPLGPPAHGYAV